MALRDIRNALGWCTLINLCLLLVWFLVFALAHDWMYRLHGRWFQISVETFDAIHYTGMALFKAGTWFFNLAPWLALHIAGGKK
ncbi:MAG: hypothetical protein A4E69_02761 [Syntrophus sp. PtaB.Bin138]|jgi:hypothetical protein|nr:MAG: hypothetical protein A4E69_02761 [Syntrophus sp. PtaB.Bin138]